MDEQSIKMKSSMKTEADDKLVNCFSNLSRGNLFRQHVAYNLRCVTGIISNTHHEARHHNSQLILSCHGVNTLSACINNVINGSQKAKRSIDESDLQSISMITDVLYFIIDSKVYFEMSIIRELGIPKALLSIIENCSPEQLEELSSAFLFLDNFLPSEPVYMHEIRTFEIIYMKLHEITLSMQSTYGCIKLLSTAIKQNQLSNIIAGYLQDMLLINKLNDLVYSNNISKDSEKIVVKTLLLLFQLLTFDTSCQSKLVGIPFGVIIGRLLKHFPDSEEIPKYGGDLLFMINEQYLTQIFQELFSELELMLASKNEVSSERVLDAIAGFSLIAAGRALCLSSGIASLLLQSAQDTDRITTERSMSVLLSITSDFELPPEFDKEREVMTTAYEVLAKYAGGAGDTLPPHPPSPPPPPDDSLRIMTQAVRLMNAMGRYVTSRSSNVEFGGMVGSTRSVGGLSASTGDVDVDVLESVAGAEMSLRDVFTAAASLIVERPHVLTHCPVLSEAYLEFILHAMRQEPSLCSERNLLRSLACALKASCGIDQSEIDRQKTLHAVTILIEEMARHLTPDLKDRRVNAVDGLRPSVGSLASLLVSDARQDMDSSEYSVAAAAENDRFLGALSTLVKDTGDVGVQFFTEIIEQLPSTSPQKKLAHKQLTSVMSELQHTMSVSQDIVNETSSSITCDDVIGDVTDNKTSEQGLLSVGDLQIGFESVSESPAVAVMAVALECAFEADAGHTCEDCMPEQEISHPVRNDENDSFSLQRRTDELHHHQEKWTTSQEAGRTENLSGYSEQAQWTYSFENASPVSSPGKPLNSLDGNHVVDCLGECGVGSGDSIFVTSEDVEVDEGAAECVTNRDQKGRPRAVLSNTINAIHEYLDLDVSKQSSVSNIAQLKEYIAELQNFESMLCRSGGGQEDEQLIVIELLINCLRETLHGLAAATVMLASYQWQNREGSLSYDLELTMSMLKGEIFTLTQACMPEYLKIIDMVSKSEQTCDAMFKTAHLEVKRAVMDIAGCQGSDKRWTLSDELLDQILGFKKQSLLKSLRVLVVCYDNLTPSRKSSLVTASELVKNREWLVKLGRKCISTEVDNKRRDAALSINIARRRASSSAECQPMANERTSPKSSSSSTSKASGRPTTPLSTLRQQTQSSASKTFMRTTK